MVHHKRHHKPNQNWNLDETIIFDSDSTIKVTFMNPNLFTDNTNRNNHLHMYTNACTNKITLQGEIKIFGDIWYDLTQMSNKFIFSQLSDKHCISYDNW